MIAISGDRDILIGIFSGRLTPQAHGYHIKNLTECRNEEVTAIFGDTPEENRAPESLVIDTTNLHEFFAWCATFLPHWSPLSSSIRILERRRVQDGSEPHANRLPRAFMRGLICMAIGEFMYELCLTSSKSAPSILSIRSTFGYSAATAMVLGGTCLGDLLSKWTRAQHLLQVNPRRIRPATLKIAWSPLFALAESDFKHHDPVVTAEELANVIARESGAALFSSRSAFDDAPRRREQIVVELESLINNSKLSDSSNCFAVSILGSRISTSPLTHFTVLGEMASFEPRVLLWYSFLSGLLSTDPASPFLERLLFQLEGELRREPAIRSDVLLEELEALIGADGQVPDSIGIGARFINVELHQGVSGSFRVMRESASEAVAVSRSDSKSQFSQLLEQLRLLFEKSVEGSQPDLGRAKSQDVRRRRKT